MQSSDRKPPEQGCRYGEVNVVEWDDNMCHRVHLSNLFSLFLPSKALSLYFLASMMIDDAVVVAFASYVPHVKTLI